MLYNYSRLANVFGLVNEIISRLGDGGLVSHETLGTLRALFAVCQTVLIGVLTIANTLNAQRIILGTMESRSAWIAH
jgi:hypothetical protein